MGQLSQREGENARAILYRGSLLTFDVACAPLFLRPPQTLLLPYRYLRELPSTRRLPWRRPILLLYVALRRVPDVVCCRATGHEHRDVHRDSHGREAAPREWMEIAQSADRYVSVSAGGEHVYSGRFNNTGWEWVRADCLR